MSNHSDDHVELRAVELPANLPSCDTIAQLCDAAGFSQNGVPFEVDGIPRFWIKYGSHYSLALGEALTQSKVAQIVNADPASAVRVPEVYFVFSRERRRYIVMQYVAGDTVESRKLQDGTYLKSDVAAVADAVKQLIKMRVPSDTPPGYVGGGLIGHSFFLEWRSTEEYPTFGHLQDQINKLVAPQNLRVDFSSESAEGLVLCPSDIDAANFMIDSNGTLFAIDFGCTGYMPPSFVSYSFMNLKPFSRMVARLIEYLIYANLSAMSLASSILVLGGDNSLGFSRKRREPSRIMN